MDISKDKAKKAAGSARLEFEAGSDPLIGAASYPQADGGVRQNNGFVDDLGQFHDTAGIKVIGVGGGGCNAVDSMVEDGLQGVQFIAINTDEQSLNRCSADVRIQIGRESTRGLGAGADPEVGRRAVEENKEAGAAPVVANLAKQSGALTVAIVTKPFSFEGRRRMKKAEEGIENLRREVDAIIVVPNDSIFNVISTESRADAFNLSNDVLRSGVQGISEIITSCGEQNVDFADVRTIMADKGSALLGIGVDGGENRAENAARQAISSPLWEGDIQGATGVLFNVVAADNFTMQELQAAANVIYEAVDPDANIIFGSVTDNSMDRDVRITVVATGFPERVEEAEEPDEGFSFGNSGEEVAFASQQPNVSGSQDYYEPAIRRRSRPSM